MENEEDNLNMILSKTDQDRLDKKFLQFSRIDPPNLKLQEYFMFIFDRGLINENISYE